MDRCTGHCCERFYLPFNPVTLQANAKGAPDDKQLQQVAGMVIHLETETVYHPTLPNLKTGEKNWYTCKNYVKETHRCGIYETRPNMCKEYPYGSPCRYKTCTWDAGRAGTYPHHGYARNMLRLAITNDPRYSVFEKFRIMHDKGQNNGETPG